MKEVRDLATIKDVAAHAGVSYATVSKTINNYPDVNDKTRERVLQSIKELNYVPNQSARSLVNKKSKTIVFVVSDIATGNEKDNNVFDAFKGMHQVVSECGYDLTLFPSNYKNKRTYVDFCREHKVCGAVLLGIGTEDSYFEDLKNLKIPCVLIDRKVEKNDDNIYSMSIDNTKASMDAIDLLISKNHTAIAMMNGDTTSNVSITRLEGYKRALEKHNINYNEELVVYGNYNEQDSRREFLNLYRKHPITAVFCASDIMAISVMETAKELGLKVPRDLSVVGFDDLIIASYTTPKLTTIAQSFYAMGYQSCSKIIEVLDNNTIHNSNNIIVNYELIIRDSVALKMEDKR